MRRLLWGIVIAAVLVAVVMGCSGAHRYDARLVAADSLMQPAPDSALALIEALPIDSLTDEGDRAYRALLLTQARYRCYIVATSDSDINRALGYYRAHAREREKLTRAYIYKGAVMEELGHPDSAMFYYKQAEATADEKDYANLGQINIRIASLYRMFYGDKEICFDKYSNALKYFKLLGDKPKQQNCLFNMAGCVGITGRGNAEYYFKAAIELAVELNDSSSIVNCYELWSRQLSMEDSTRSEAKRIVLKCLNNYPKFMNLDLIIDLAFIYAMDDMIDSARYYLNIAERYPANDHMGQIQTRKNSILAIIAKSQKNPVQNNYYSCESQRVADSMVNNQHRYMIQHIENANIAQQARTKNRHIDFMRWLLISFAFVFVITAIMMALSILAFRRHLKAKTKEHEKMKDELNAVICDLNEKLKCSKDGKTKATAIVKTRMEAFQELFDSIKFKSKNEDSGKNRKILTLRKILGSLDDQYDLLKVDLSDSFWEKIRLSVDGEFNGIVTFVESNYPNLSTRDIRIFCLLCTRITPQIMKLCMNLTSPRSASNYRSLIMKKLNLNMTFEEFLSNYMKGKINR